MTENTPIILRANVGYNVLGLAGFSAATLFVWLNIDVLENEVGDAAWSVIILFCYLALVGLSINDMVKGYPLLCLYDDRLELRTAFSRKVWMWRQTGTFSLSPPPGLAASHCSLVAMYPGNVVEFQQLSDRPTPDFVDADIIILLGRYRVSSDAETALAFLDQVNAMRTKSLASSPLDQNYVGPDAEDKPNSLRSIVKRRRLLYAIPIVISLLLLASSLLRLLGFR
jgi:hypothetical protein